MNFDNNLKYNLDYLYRNSKLSQAEFGKSIGVSQKMLSNYISGKSQMSLDLIIRIAAKFNYSIDELVFDKIDNPYKQFEELKRKTQGLPLSKVEERESKYDLDSTNLGGNEFSILLKSVLKNETSIAVLTSFLTKNHQHLKEHPIYGMYVKQMKLEGENEKDELWLDIRDKISESKLKQILKIINDKKVSG
ncbi:MAG: helix-turn-helix transcriptional regulator [Bacteroidota bacterium]